MREFDAIVVGAGPAGAIAALSLARAGVQVGLFEKARLPRDKVCGDVLMPDSLATLDALYLRAEIDPHTHPIQALHLSSPKNRGVRLALSSRTIQRSVLDALLVEAAVRAGAVMCEGVTVDAPLWASNGVIRGLRCKDDRGRRFEARATVVILATGAASGPLRKFGVGLRTQPSALAMRAYFRAPALKQDTIVAAIAHTPNTGVGWAIPMGDGRANVGCGIFLEGGAVGADLRRVMADLQKNCPALRDALEGAGPLTEFRGAPLRCGLDGAEPLGPGLLVAGESVGATDGLTGMGIGGAMDGGRMAAMAAIGALNTGAVEGLDAYLKLMARDAIPKRHAASLAARRFVSKPAALESLFWRMGRSGRLRARAEAVLQGERSADEILSWRGLLGP